MNGYRQEEADPLTTFDLRRFNAVRGQQGQIGREISRCLKELRHAQEGSTRGRHGRTRAWHHGAKFHEQMQPSR